MPLYPAHLATLNLAAREINDEANYPRIARRNFFDFEPAEPFCHVPDSAGEHAAVPLPAWTPWSATRPTSARRRSTRSDKARFGADCSDAWPGLRLTGRSDLHCYFWPAAARLLKPDGYFGFLTSSSWLDVEYGFALQGWMLRHFRILAVMESAAEPWFEDARVKTCVTILQRCDDEAARMANRVRFVRFDRKLADIIGVPPGQDEDARQAAIEALRKRILDAKPTAKTRTCASSSRRRATCGPTACAPARSWAMRTQPRPPERTKTKTATEAASAGSDRQRPASSATRPTTTSPANGADTSAPRTCTSTSCGGSASGSSPLGEIATIRFGVKSGCDAFFMPKDITAEMLAAHRRRPRVPPATPAGAAQGRRAGKLRIIEAGDGSVHPIEAKYLAPEVHSLMKVDAADRPRRRPGPRGPAGRRADGQTEGQVALGVALPAVRHDGARSRPASRRPCPSRSARLVRARDRGTT